MPVGSRWEPGDPIWDQPNLRHQRRPMVESLNLVHVCSQNCGGMPDAATWPAPRPHHDLEQWSIREGDSLGA